MLCACVDIGSNTTRLLVADVAGGRLRDVLHKRAFTRIGKDLEADGLLTAGKIAEVTEVVADYRRTARSLGVEAIRTVATAGIRAAANREELIAALRSGAGVETHVLDGVEEAHLAFLGATRTFAGALDGEIGVVDVGGGSSEVILGSIAGGVSEVHSFKIGSGMLAEEFIRSDPPGPAEIRGLRDRIADFFEGVEIRQPEQAVAVGGSATSLRRLVGAVLEYETLERGIRVLTGDPAAEVAKRFELDPRRVEILASGVLILEQLSQLLGQPLQIGKGGLREGVILDRLHDETKQEGDDGTIAA